MVVFVRKFGSFEQTELKNLGDLDTLTVEEFLKQVSQKLELKDEYSLVYAGRILRPTKKLSDYKIKHGATVFILNKGPPTTIIPVPTIPVVFKPEFVDLMQEERVQQVIFDVVTNRALIQTIMPPPFANLLNYRSIFENPESPQSLARYLTTQPQMIEMGQALMTSLVNNNDQGITPHSREEFISLLEETLHQELEEMDTSDSELSDNDSDNGGRGDELMEQVAESQQMMYEHSQAILAHEQNQSSSSASVTDGQGQRQVITPGDLASAFASLEQRGSTSSSSVVQPPSRTTTPASSSISQASGPISQSSRRGVITPSMLNQALVNTSSSATPRSGLPHPHRQAHGRTPRRRYEQQLAQLHSLGISDDAACLHALEATGGSVEGALELLMEDK